MLEHEKAWVACAIDSEGTIFGEDPKGRRRDYLLHWQMSVCNTSLEYIRHFCFLTGVAERYIHMRYRDSTRPWRPIYEVKVTKKVKLLEILEEILPYLVIKRNLASEAIRYMKTHGYITTRNVTREEIGEAHRLAAVEGWTHRCKKP